VTALGASFRGGPKDQISDAQLRIGETRRRLKDASQLRDSGFAAHAAPRNDEVGDLPPLADKLLDDGRQLALVATKACDHGLQHFLCFKFVETEGMSRMIGQQSEEREL
jgi:hypothetical protein